MEHNVRSIAHRGTWVLAIGLVLFALVKIIYNAHSNEQFLNIPKLYLPWDTLAHGIVLAVIPLIAVGLTPGNSFWTNIKTKLDWQLTREDKIIIITATLTAATMITAGIISPVSFHSEIARSLASQTTLINLLIAALIAGTTEEIFFRGILQNKVGVFGQALIFGIAHYNYMSLISVAVIIGIGLVFGYLRKRGHSITALIIMHIIIDIIAVSLAKIAVS